MVSAPARYARAVFSGSASSMDPPATVTLVLASDGRQFRCGLACKPHGCSLSGLRPVLQALGVAAGSQLRFARVAGGPPLSSGSRSDLRRPKLLFARAEGGEAEPLDTYKLHRPAATYTTHPQWQYLSGGDCSLEEACKLLADHGVAAEFLKPPPAAGGQSQGRGQPMPRQGQQGQQGQQQQQQQQQQHLHQHQQQQQQQQPGAGGGTPGQSGRGVEGRLGGSSGGGGGGGLPVAGAGRTSDRWQGLFPEDTGCYSVRLSPSLASGKGSDTTIPAAYVEAIAGTEQAPLMLTVTTPDGMQHSWHVRFYERQGLYYLCRVGATAATLGASAGDRLCIQPTDPAEAKVWLEREAAGAGVHPDAQQQQQPEQQAAASGSSGKRSRDTEDAWQPGSGNEGGSEGSYEGLSSSSGGSLEAERLLAGRLLSGGSRRPQKGRGSRVASTDKWSGLEEGEEDEGVYTLTLPAAAFKEGGSLKIHTPARYLKALFGEAPKVGQPATPITITALSRSFTCGMALYSRRKGCVLLGVELGSLLASLGAQLGDELQLQPAGEQQASRRSGGLPTNWRGLESEGTGRYSLVLSPIVVHREHRAGIPERYAVAVFGQSPAQLNQQKLAVTATTPADGRGGKLQLGGLTSLLSSLSAAAGDRLCFKPVGKLAATATLIPAAAAAAAGGGGVAGPEWQAAEPQLPQQQVGSTALPSTAAEPGQQKRGFSHSNWSALGPEVTDRYAVVLPSHAVSDCRVWVPDRYATAVFGHSPHQLNQDKLAVTVTAADETHSLTLSARHGSACQLSGMRSLLASLGAAAGDQLCFQPAGPLAAEVTLIKAAAAAAGGGTGEPAQQQLDEDGIEEMEYEEEAVEADWEQAEDAQGESLQPQHSPAADGGQSGAAGGWSGPPSQAAQQQHPTSAVSAEMSALLKTAEEHGCLPAGALATYQAKFDAHPSLDWQLMCRTTLRALVQERNWGAVGAWIQTVLPP
ncbi:hypothetical protein C2E21_2307 [Chlorella sorokiniana]|uniref:Uncharacterized protein n=1 Tax=Chlorella sorokiniana TaxID=3076 RepID=A0A2P6TZB3_CHLSO|nr:hypothetical protein C2E21_2307 [Chlorella sorokiniana]|eukprot:PRW59404.1 hypothetical protein C2E21_2307 [Chlorella sorokiniana]